jgi:uncharacterized damage-inducible protein DinB
MANNSNPTSGSALAELLRKGHSNNPWHGPATADLLASVSPDMAAARPVADGHSVWEIVLHMTGWQREVARRLGGATPGLPDEGDWPEPPASSQEAWDRAKADLRESLEQLADAVASLSDQDLEDRIGTSSRPLGTGVTKAETAMGMLQHNAYHSGQIALLVKELR